MRGLRREARHLPFPHHATGCIPGRRREEAIIARQIVINKLNYYNISNVTKFYDASNAFASVFTERVLEGQTLEMDTNRIYGYMFRDLMERGSFIMDIQGENTHEAGIWYHAWSFHC